MMLLKALRAYLGLPHPTAPHEHEWGVWQQELPRETKIFAKAADKVPLRTRRTIIQWRACERCQFREYDKHDFDI